MSKNVFLTLITACCLLYSTILISAEPSPGLTTLLEQAKASILIKDYRSIKDSLQPYEALYAGNPSFDYYLGTAYLELKEYSEAAFALDRAVTVNPKFAGAMFELARVYFYLEEYIESERLFNTVLAMSPPKNIENAITTYLKVIANKEFQYKNVHNPSVVFSIGYDSNANNATAIDEINGIIIANKNRETSSPYYSLILSDSLSFPIAPDWYWKTSGSLLLRNNPSAEFVDMNVGILNTGFEWNTGTHELSFDIGSLISRVAGEPLELAPELAAMNIDYQTENLDRKGSFINTAYSYQTALKTTFTFGVTVSEFTHEDILAIRDMEESLFYMSVKTDFLTNSQLLVSLFTSTDEMKIATSPYGNNEQGLKLSLMSQINASIISSINYQYSETDFDGIFFGASRKDKLTGIDISVTWLVDKDMSYWGKITFVENNSTDRFNLYSYEKSVFELGISYQF